MDGGQGGRAAGRGVSAARSDPGRPDRRAPPAGPPDPRPAGRRSPRRAAALDGTAGVEMNGVEVRVVRPDELGPAELDRWRAFQLADRRLANPFLAPEFALAVARHQPTARVAVL